VIEFLEVAQEEMRAATSRYISTANSAGVKFLDAIRAALSKLKNDPESFPEFDEGFRCVRVSKFPYIIIFKIESDGTILVIAFSHTSRCPDYWRGRT